MLVRGKTYPEHEEVAMSDAIAKEDITETNEAGQTIVVVPAGQPIPKDLDPKAKARAKKADGDAAPEAQDNAPKAGRPQAKPSRRARAK